MLSSQEMGIQKEGVEFLTRELRSIVDAGLGLAVVVGGGNFWRARDQVNLNLERSGSDALGMMASLMNARILHESLKKAGLPSRVFSPHVDGYFAELYVPAEAKKAMEQGTVVLLGGGTGNPYFTTDTTAALRALELGCERLLKATQVDGVYEEDPKKNPKAKKYDQISYGQVLDQELGVMDLTAITLCKENDLPLQVFSSALAGNCLKAAQGKHIGTLIHS